MTLFAVLIQFGQEFRIKIEFVGECPSMRSQYRRFHSPEVGEENPFHPTCSENTGQRREGEEDRQVEDSPRLTPENPMAKKDLAVPRQ